MNLSCCLQPRAYSVSYNYNITLTTEQPGSIEWVLAHRRTRHVMSYDVHTGAVA